MKQRFLILAACLLGSSLMAGDADFSQMLIGTWDFAWTNAAAKHATEGCRWMSRETKYSADGTLTLTGEGGEIRPTNRTYQTCIQREGGLVPNPESYRKTISGSGVWRVEHGCLCTTVTSSTGTVAEVTTDASGRQSTNILSAHGIVTNEHCDEILSVTPQLFSYRSKLGGPTNTAVRKALEQK